MGMMWGRRVVGWLLLAGFAAGTQVFAEEGPWSFEVDGITFRADEQAVRDAYAAAGYELVRAQKNKTGTVLRFVRKSGSRRVTVVLTVSDEGVVSFSSGVRLFSDLAEAEKELERVKRHFGGEDACGESKNWIRCTFTFQSESRNYRLRFNLVKRKRNYSYSLTSRYDAARAAQAEARRKLLERIPCLATFDPADARQTAECLGSVTFDKSGTGRTTLLAGVERSCSSGRDNYLAYLAENRVVPKKTRGKRIAPGSPEAARYRVPDCATYAAVAEEVQGTLPPWSRCLGYGTPEHSMEECINGSAGELTGLVQLVAEGQACAKVRGFYEEGLKRASFDQALPKGYAPPPCPTVMNFVYAQMGGVPEHLQPCYGYDPAKAKEQVVPCVEANYQLIQLRTCEEVTRRYAEMLTQANGGLPENYVAPQCSHMEGLLARAEVAWQEYEKQRLEEEARVAEERRRLEEQRRLEEEERRRVAMERMRERQRQWEEARRRQMEASNRYWNEVMAQGERAVKSLSVQSGELVSRQVIASSPGQPAPKQATAEAALGQREQSGRFAEFEQAGILEALYQGRRDLLDPKRRDILVYLVTFGAVLGGEGVGNRYPECRPYLSAASIQRMEDEILSSTGMDRVLSGNLEEAGAASLGMTLALLREVMTSGYGRLYQGSRAVDLLKQQAENDAFRFAHSIRCDSDVSRLFKANLVDFIDNRQ